MFASVWAKVHKVSIILGAPVNSAGAPVTDLRAPVEEATIPLHDGLIGQLPQELQDMITRLGKRTGNREAVEQEESGRQIGKFLYYPDHCKTKRQYDPDRRGSTPAIDLAPGGQ